MTGAPEIRTYFLRQSIIGPEWNFPLIAKPLAISSSAICIGSSERAKFRAFR
jgi:hypothetical protein